MDNAKAARKQVEAALNKSMPGALTPKPHPQLERVACGIGSVDDLLHGSLPVGMISELVGKDGSGRTSVALAYLSAHILAGNVCAWIDVADSLDPESVAANHVDLERLLWVRCGKSFAQQEAPLETAPQTPQGNCVEESLKSQPRHTGGGSPHPRSEARDMPQAISSMFQAHGGLHDKQLRREKPSIGTPSAPNRPLTPRSEDREEQVNFDRLPPRRGDNLTITSHGKASQCTESQHRRVTNSALRQSMYEKSPTLYKAPRSALSIWRTLDQALRVTDLILQGGGFSAIVLDLGSVSSEIVWRIPLATWFRFRAACERTRVSVILLLQHPCACSAAELVVRLQPGTMQAQNKVMTGIQYRATVERSRSREHECRVVSIRNPSRVERLGEWTSTASWA